MFVKIYLSDQSFAKRYCVSSKLSSTAVTLLFIRNLKMKNRLVSIRLENFYWGWSWWPLCLETSQRLAMIRVNFLAQFYFCNIKWCAKQLYHFKNCFCSGSFILLCFNFNSEKVNKKFQEKTQQYESSRWFFMKLYICFVHHFRIELDWGWKCITF